MLQMTATRFHVTQAVQRRTKPCMNDVEVMSRCRTCITTTLDACLRFVFPFRGPILSLFCHFHNTQQTALSVFCFQFVLPAGTFDGLEVAKLHVDLQILRHPRNRGMSSRSPLDRVSSAFLVFFDASDLLTAGGTP